MDTFGTQGGETLWAHSGHSEVIHSGHTLITLGTPSGHTRGTQAADPSSSSLLSSLEHKSMSLKYQPSSEPLHISVEYFSLICTLRWQTSGMGSAVERSWNKQASQGQILASA